MLSLELEPDDGTPLAGAASRAVRHAQARARPRRAAARAQLLPLGSPTGPRTESASRSNRTERPADIARHRRRRRPHQVAAPRGQFTLDDGALPVALVSAGVGVTPVLAMLHALHDSRSTRDIWWLHGARNGAEHAFAQEARSLLATLPTARSRVWYSQPDPGDRIGTDFDELGRITPRGSLRPGAPTRGEFYLCGPAAFMTAVRTGLDTLGVPTCPRAHRDVRRRWLRSRRASSRRQPGHRTRPKVRRARARSCPSSGPA